MQYLYILQIYIPNHAYKLSVPSVAVSECVPNKAAAARSLI